MPKKRQESDDPLDILGEHERAQVEEAVRVVNQQIPDVTIRAQVLAYANQNIQAQETIASVKSQFQTRYQREWMKRCEYTAGEREDLKEEGVRAQGERDEMVYRDPKIRDLTLSCTRIKVLVEYLNGLEWRLKSAIKMVERQ